MILFGVVEHKNRIAVMCDLYGGKRVVALAGHRLQVTGYSVPDMRVSDVSEGAGIYYACVSTDEKFPLWGCPVISRDYRSTPLFLLQVVGRATTLGVWVAV